MINLTVKCKDSIYYFVHTVYALSRYRTHLSMRVGGRKEGGREKERGRERGRGREGETGVREGRVCIF